MDVITESLKEGRLPLSAVILQQLEEIWEKRYNNKNFQAIKFLAEEKELWIQVSYMKIIVDCFWW